MIIRDLSTKDFVCYSYLDEYTCYIHAYFVNVKRLNRLKIGQKTFSGYSWKILSKTLRPPFSFFYFFFFSFSSSLPLFIQSRFPKLGSSHLNEFDYERNNGPYERTEFHQFLFRTNGWDLCRILFPPRGGFIVVGSWCKVSSL